MSGNDVPIGSLQEEVRDDIPAQLSEGEFVMPADVVRYHCHDKMMALRDEAKMGLRRMEAMGQMGNSEEATLPDDVPFGLEDLDIAEEPLEMQVGGFVPTAPQITPGGVQQYQFQHWHCYAQSKHTWHLVFVLLGLLLPLLPLPLLTLLPLLLFLALLLP